MFGNVTSFKHRLFNNVSVVNVAEDNDNTGLKMHLFMYHGSKMIP